MQRKAVADSSFNIRRQQQHDDDDDGKKRNNNRNHIKASPMADGSIDRKRDHNAISSSPSSPPSSTSLLSSNKSNKNTNNTIKLQLASVVDMYGIGSDIIGRRSFGGFHKSVRSTWETALQQRTDSAARERNTRSHITDEELLERYEKYVKGRSSASTSNGEKMINGGGGKEIKQNRKRKSET